MQADNVAHWNGKKSEGIVVAKVLASNKGELF